MPPAAATAAPIAIGPSITRTGSEIMLATIAAVVRIGRVGRIAIHERAGEAASRRAFESVIVEAVAPRRRAQHPAAARIGVVPDDAPIRRHPFEVIVWIAGRTVSGALGVIEIARMLTADAGQEPVQRLNTIPGAIA